MKALIPTKTLSETLGHVERVIPNRSSNPGLSLLKVEIEDGRLTFSGSNMDIDVRSVVETDVRGRGELACRPASSPRWSGRCRPTPSNSRSATPSSRCGRGASPRASSS
jgi:hypothetical protein